LKRELTDLQSAIESRELVVRGTLDKTAELLHNALQWFSKARKRQRWTRTYSFGTILNLS